MDNAKTVGAIRRVALWDEFDFLIIIIIVLLAFVAGIICGGEAVKNNYKSVGVIHELPLREGGTP